LRRSIALFRQAINIDPAFGHAYVELAKAYALLPSYSTEVQEEMYSLALATLAAGLEKDPTLDAAMESVRALIAFARWDWSAAEIAFRAALRQPVVDPDVLVWYSQFLSAGGRPGESVDQARRAKELDPVSPVVNHRLSVALMWIDKDDEALEHVRIADEFGMGPRETPDSHIVLSLRLKDYEEVRTLLLGAQLMFARETAWIDPFLEALEFPDRRAAAIGAIARAAKNREIAPKYLFGTWLYLNESDRAVEAGLKLVNDRPSFNVEFLFSREARALRANERFGELLHAIGLDAYWDRSGRWPEFCAKNGEHIVCH
jgi:tetratricopeptide (TPR) repeat protein